MTAALPWADRIGRVVDHIHEHLDAEVRPDELARLAEFSLHHFHRVFRGVTGESVMGCVRRLRLERAAQRLRFGSEPVTDVALATGYESHEGFTRAFHARFGASPRDFRAAARPEVASAATLHVRRDEARACIGVRHVGDYAECKHAWDRLAAIAGPRGWLERATASVGLCYDDPEITAVERLRYDACLVLPDEHVPRELPAGLVRRQLPAGRYAVALHHGPYDTLDAAYVALLGQWLPVRGVELADEPVFEIYLDDPALTPAAELRTEICVRIE